MVWGLGFGVWGLAAPDERGAFAQKENLKTVTLQELQLGMFGFGLRFGVRFDFLDSEFGVCGA